MTSTDAAREATQDATEEAAFATYLAAQRPVRPVWLYGPAAGTCGVPTPEVPDSPFCDLCGERGELRPHPDSEHAVCAACAHEADDAPDTTPRPALSVFADAASAAARRRDEHDAACACCQTALRCEWGARLARWADDAQDAAVGALASAR